MKLITLNDSQILITLISLALLLLFSSIFGSLLEKIDKASRCRYGAPVVLIICGNRDEAYHKGEYSTYEMDSCIVTTHMMLEATNIGVDNIWVESFDENILREEFNIGEELTPVCLLPLGYRDNDCPINPLHDKRKDINELVIYI